MTDDKFLKALEFCINTDEINVCNECPFDKECGKDPDALLKNALDLIKRQKAEIEELRKGFTADADYFASEYDSKIKAEAIKEFAERFKKKYEKPFFYLGSYEQFMREVDNLVKEMADENFTKIEHNSLCETETYRKGGE